MCPAELRDQARRLPHLARWGAKGVRLFTRNGYDFTARFPLVEAAIEALPVRSRIVDGEAIVCNEDGLAVFDLMAALVATMIAICDEFEACGYRRVGAELRHRGIVVNFKKIRRLMRENDLQPKRCKRFVATTDGDHDGPIFPDLARHRILDGPNQVWVADITYIAIATGFVYMTAILDAWSRRVVGYAISRSIDARLAVAALKAAIRVRQPPKGCIHHSDRGSQYASEVYRGLLTDHGLVGSMGRRGNPYDNAKAESFMKTLKVEAVYLDGLRNLRGCDS